MTYALYPGCVSRGACPELYDSTLEVCRRLGIELDLLTMQSASCTGAGVLQEKNQRLGDTLNARNFAMAESAGQEILTICSTCQGVMAQANARLQDDEYRASVNEDLAEEGLRYNGNGGPAPPALGNRRRDRRRKASISHRTALAAAKAGALLRLLHSAPVVRPSSSPKTRSAKTP